MSEEEFKPIRITLSDEAFTRLDTIMKVAAFRSYSSTIEECIRIVYDIIEDIWAVIGKKDDPYTAYTFQEAAFGFETIATRMTRITGRTITKKPPEKASSSAGP